MPEIKNINTGVCEHRAQEYSYGSRSKFDSEMFFVNWIEDGEGKYFFAQQRAPVYQMEMRLRKHRLLRSHGKNRIL